MSAFVTELVRGDGPVRATGIARPREGSWIVGDVRLDGIVALRDALGGAGVVTSNEASDTELVFAAWTAWRETATERLIGDFSFALWDARERTLFCARDPLGVRQLYWAELGGTFVCGNVLNEVRAHPRISSRLHRPAIVSFLKHGHNTDTGTTSFADVRRLPPGHQLTVSAGASALAPRRYWSFPVPEPLRLKRDDEYIERFRAVLGDAVRDRLCAGRAAILLSGGLDSTSLAATARRVSPATLLSAWTSDPGESQPPDENRLATAVANRLDITHEIIRTEPAPFVSAVAAQTPEPVDEPGWGEWLRQLRKVSARAPVLMIGEDGDALFRPPGLATMLRTWPAHDVLSRVIAYTISHRHHPHLGIWLRRRILAPFVPGAERAPRWIRTDVLARADSLSPTNAPQHATRPDAVQYLANPIWQGVLEAAQPAYTGVPLDIVWPLLDVRLIDFVFSIPPVPWCQRKELVRRAFRGELPDEVLSRRKAPLSGLFEEQVARWRATWQSQLPTLGSAVREFVDTPSVADTLKTGSVDAVLAVRRAFVLDQWLRAIPGG